MQRCISHFSYSVTCESNGKFFFIAIFQQVVPSTPVLAMTRGTLTCDFGHWVVNPTLLVKGQSYVVTIRLTYVSFFWFRIPGCSRLMAGSLPIISQSHDKCHWSNYRNVDQIENVTRKCPHTLIASEISRMIRRIVKRICLRSNFMIVVIFS